MHLPRVQVSQTSAASLIEANAIKMFSLVLARGLCTASLLDLLFRALLEKGPGVCCQSKLFSCETSCVAAFFCMSTNASCSIQLSALLTIRPFCCDLVKCGP